MSQLLQRFDAVKDRIKVLDARARAPDLSRDEKLSLIHDLVQCGISIGEIALEKMEGDKICQK